MMEVKANFKQRLQALASFLNWTKCFNPKWFLLELSLKKCCPEQQVKLQWYANNIAPPTREFTIG